VSDDTLTSEPRAWTASEILNGPVGAVERQADMARAKKVYRMIWTKGMLAFLDRVNKRNERYGLLGPRAASQRPRNDKPAVSSPSWPTAKQISDGIERFCDAEDALRKHGEAQSVERQRRENLLKAELPAYDLGRP
jgi:hypothetical protein